MSRRLLLSMPVLALVGCANEADQEVAWTLSGEELEVTPFEQVPTPPYDLGLSIGALVAGATGTLTASGADAGATVHYLHGGVGAGPCPAALGGLCIDVTGPTLIGTAVADAAGVAELGIPVPSGLVGATVNVQAMQLAGVDTLQSPVVSVTIGAAGGACSGGGTSILDNPGFESGLTSWQSNGAPVVSGEAYEGSTSGETAGNYDLEQLFNAVPVASLTSATFRAWHDAADFPAMSVDWTYDDGSSDSECCFSGLLGDWMLIDVMPYLDATKNIDSIRVWGYSGGGAAPDVVRRDDFQFCI